jgi:hypothetical protein
MCLRYRVKISFITAGLILSAMSLSSPSLGQAPVETRPHARQPLAPHPLGHRHVRGAMIVCGTSDVQACKRDFAHKHRGQPLHQE